LPLYFSKEKRHKVSTENEIKTISDLTKTLGIEQLLDKKITELSVGQQQRVAAARALIGSPELILADEPTSALDYDHREKFIRLLFSVAEKNNSTVIFVSHDKSLEKIFDRTISLAEINKAGVFA
jgi:putative ABC transport system ATP-binding protein